LAHKPIRTERSFHENGCSSCVATAVFSVRLLHAVAFSKKLPWLAQTKVISLKTQPHAVNACVKKLIATQL